MSMRIVTRDRERRGGDVGRRDAGLCNLASETDRQAAASRADVGEPGRAQIERPQDGERLLDDELGFRARDEHVTGDAELEPPELASAHDVGGRLPIDATGKPFRQAWLERRRRGFSASDEDTGAIPAEDRAREEIDVDRRLGGIDARGHQLLARLRQALMQERHSWGPTVVTSLSFCAL